MESTVPATENTAPPLGCRFHKGCFDVEKLKKKHLRHSGSKQEVPASERRNIDMPCAQCRLVFAGQPWDFLHDTGADISLHLENDLKAYMLIRFDKREQFLVELAKLDRQRAAEVERRMEEFSRSRKAFATYGPKLRLLLSLKGWRDKWTTGSPTVLELGQSVAAPSRCRMLAKRGLRQSTAFTDSLAMAAWKHQVRQDPGVQATTSTTVPDEQSFGGHHKVGIMYFKRKTSDEPYLGDTLNVSSFGVAAKDEFPDQRMPIDDVLSTDKRKLERNPLARECPANTLRYFHLPANNMVWVEEAMARYYRETRRQHNDNMAVENMLNHEKLLRREFWHGQIHGGINGPVHARHMRPRCSVIPRPRDLTQEESPAPGNDIALFLPYLHWEYYALQKRIQHEMDDASDDAKLQRQESPEEKMKMKMRMARRKTRLLLFERLDEDNTPSGTDTPPWGHDLRASSKGKMIASAAAERLREYRSHGDLDESDVRSSDADDGTGEKKLRRKSGSRQSVLANLLWTVAQVVAEIRFSEQFLPDTRMLRRYIHHDPPLHVRRTLDQFYFNTLQDTSVRDCDQVVHRGTRAATQGSPRIIMVDQLWLWILDDNTIITAFPKRWGRNKLDDSGVYKSIRVRLKTARKDGVKSVYHLAIIVMDQCSRVFFDRTKSRDNRPEMLDLFGSAIGNVTELTCISYQHFWRHINAITSGFMANATAEKWQRVLAINPEGELLKESQDINEELMILLQIYGQQITAVKEFRRYLATLKEDETRKKRREAETASPIRDSAAIEFSIMQKLDRLLSWHLDTTMSPLLGNDVGNMSEAGAANGAAFSAIPTQEADLLVELIGSRRLELQELDEAASRTCKQLEGLLSLKQQQASILEAKSAKIRADESVKQGRSIIAFTIVTIFFLPLGFLAAFFGMNNSVSTKDNWMTLNDQLSYMFGLSAIVVVIAISLAFSQTARTALRISVLPLTLTAEYANLGSFWRTGAVGPLKKLDKAGDGLRRQIVEGRAGAPTMTTATRDTSHSLAGIVPRARRPRRSHASEHVV